MAVHFGTGKEKDCNSMKNEHSTDTTPNLRHKIPFGVKLGYGIGSLGYAVPFQLLSSFFLFYCTAILGISGALAGVLMSVSTIWDAVTDPVMGYISDHTSRRILFGRRLFYIFIGAIGFTLVNFLIWRVDPQLRGGEAGTVKVVWVAALLLMFKTFSTVYTTPYLALGAELSSDYNERNAVQSYRTAFFFMGFLFPTVLGMGLFFRPADGYPNGQLNPAAYAALGLTASILTLVCAGVCLALTYKHRLIYTPPKAKHNPIIGLFREISEAMKLSDFRNVNLALLFINTAMGIVSAVGMHVFTYTFGFTNRQIALVFGVLFAAALLAQPAWVLIANKYDKRRALIACLWINIAVSVLFVVCVLISAWIADHYLTVMPLAVLIGFSMGGSIALPYSMISDTIDKDAYESGTRKEGVFYGCATFLYKISQSLAVFFVGALLDVIRFDSSIVQEPTVYLKLGLILPAGFLICFTLALIFACRYTLTREKVTEYQKAMQQRPEQGSVSG
jgi:GPH family glycoside/pentoside/hexuronide:cation symporter